jgi:hypothetical protein
MRFSFSACANISREMLVAHKILHVSEFVMLYCQMSRYCHICQYWSENACFEEGSRRVSGGRDDACHGWPLERYDSVAVTGWAGAHQRTQTFHSRDHGAHADPAPPGACCRRHRRKRRQENNSALRLLFAVAIWKDARPSGSNDVQLGPFAFEACVKKTMIKARTQSVTFRYHPNSELFQLVELLSSWCSVVQGYKHRIRF